MIEPILNSTFSKLTLIAFATALLIVPAASAMPMSDAGATATPRAIVVPSTTLADGWYSAALQQTPLTDGWYTAAVQQALLTDGWYSAVVQPTASSAPAAVSSPSTSTVPYRNAGIILAFGLLIAALLAAAIVKTRHDRHIPVLQ